MHRLINGSQQIIEFNGLIEISIHARKHADQCVAFLSEGAQNNQGNVRGGGVATDGTGKLIAIEMRHPHINHDAIGVECRNLFESTYPIAGNSHLIIAQ